MLGVSVWDLETCATCREYVSWASRIGALSVFSVGHASCGRGEVVWEPMAVWWGVQLGGMWEAVRCRRESRADHVPVRPRCSPVRYHV